MKTVYGVLMLLAAILLQTDDAQAQQEPALPKEPVPVQPKKEILAEVKAAAIQKKDRQQLLQKRLQAAAAARKKMLDAGKTEKQLIQEKVRRRAQLAQQARQKMLNAAKVEKQKVDRKGRIAAHFAAYQQWLNLVCSLSEKQKTDIKSSVGEAIFRADKTPLTRTTHYLFDYSPIKAAGTNGAFTKVYQAGLEAEIKKILDATQQEKLQAAMKKREQELHQLFLTHVIAKADRELFLTTAQKNKLLENFSTNKIFLKNGLYRFASNQTYFREQAMQDFLQLHNASLTKNQQARAASLKTGRANPVLVRRGVNANWENQVDNMLKQQKKIFFEFADVQLAFISAEYQITPQETRYLKLASRGAISKAISARKKEMTDPTIARVNQNIFGRGGVVVFGGGFVQNVAFSGQKTDTFNQFPIWKHAVKKVVPEFLMERRDEATRKETVGYAIALLTQELWLNTDQREKLKTVLTDPQIVLAGQSGFGHNGRQLDLSILGVAIHGKNQHALVSILNETQKEALIELKKQLLRQNSYITLVTRSGIRHLVPISPK